MKRRLLLLGAFVALIVGLYASGLHEHVTREELHALLTETGIWGPLLFVLLYALGELVNIPSVVFVIAAGLTWELPLALAIAWVSSVNSALWVFLFYRYLARELVQNRMPERFRRFDARLERGGIWPVALVRLLAFLAPWTHPVLAISSVKLRDYVIGTAIGVAPGVVLLVVMGEGITRLFD